MKNGVYYLNNSGSRWVVFNNGEKEQITLKTENGQSVTRTVIYYQSFGNYSFAVISYHGIRYSVLADTVLPDANEYLIFNETDGIMAIPEPMKIRQCINWIKEFREILKKHQGYYLTSYRERIDVDDVDFANINV